MIVGNTGWEYHHTGILLQTDDGVHGFGQRAALYPAQTLQPLWTKKAAAVLQSIMPYQYARQIESGGRNYFVLRPGIKIQGRLKQQVSCFWVLLDYIDKVDRHFATGTPGSLISMEIEGRDYSILYAQPGKEKMCCYLMEQSGRTRYFILVEDLAQIPLIRGGQIHAFVLLDEKNTIHYYSRTGG